MNKGLLEFIRNCENNQLEALKTSASISRNVAYTRVDLSKPALAELDVEISTSIGAHATFRLTTVYRLDDDQWQAVNYILRRVDDLSGLIVQSGQGGLGDTNA